MKAYFFSIVLLFIMSNFLHGQISGATCPGPYGGNGAIGDPAQWVVIGDPGNPADGPAYSTMVNGSPVIHNSTNQVGYGSVGYEFSIADGFVTIKDYLRFLNAVDPTNSLNYEGGLATVGLIQYSAGVWSAGSSYCQTLSASDVEKVAVTRISLNQKARYANWVATGDVNTGAYTFASSDGNANITAIDNTFTGVRLLTENEYYKAAFWDQANNTYNLYGTTGLDGNGLPLVSGIGAGGIQTNPLGVVYTLSSPDPNICWPQVQSGQGGRSAYGVSNMAGGFHNSMIPSSPSFPIINDILRPDNLASTEVGQRSSYRNDFTLANAFYPSPSFQIAKTGNACVCSVTVVTADPTTCNTTTNTYNLSGMITFPTSPSTGTLTISVPGGTPLVLSPPFLSPIHYDLTGLVSDGLSHTVTATFSANASCSGVKDYTAPASCNIAGTCNCKEYIYLNEPDLGAVLKFEVGNPIGLTEVVGSNGGTPPSAHWYPGTGVSELTSPHGLATDLNGKLYIGSTYAPGFPIRSLTCDGAIDPITPTTINSNFLLTSMFSIGNTIYTSRSGGPAAYNSCTGQLLGTMCLNDENGNPLPFSNGLAPDDQNWGLSYNKVIDRVFVTGRGGARRGVWAFTSQELENGILGGPCIDILIPMGTTSTINVGDNFIPTDLNQVTGVTSDNLGNIYIAGIEPSSTSSILKYNSNGEFIVRTSTNLAYQNTFGIVWSETTNRIYVANLTDDPSVDCISTFDANTLTYLGAAAPNPNLPDNNTAKALAIIKECCPVNLPSNFQKEVCGAIGTVFYLNQVAFDDCDGVVCGSSWTPVGTLTGMTFDACDNSVVVTGSGCGTFTLNIGAVTSTGCGAQSSTFTICNTVPSATLTGVQGTCSGSTANNNASLNITGASNADQAGISAGGTYSGPSYSGVGTINISSGSGSFLNLMHNTQYTVRIFNGSDACYVDYTMTTPSITCNACNLVITCNSQPQTNCTPVNGSASVTVSGGQGIITYLWSSGETNSGITNKTAGTYTVTVTDDFLPGCTKTCQAVIANNASAPTCTITPNNQPSCANLSGGSVTVMPSQAGSYSYFWNNGLTTATLTGLTGGTYTVTVTNTTTGCTGMCDITLTTPTNCCNINTIVPQNLVCLDNGTPYIHTDNRIRFSAQVTNTNAALTAYNVTINGGTTITPNTNVAYGNTQFTLGPGTAGGGATFTVTVTDSVTLGCIQTFQVTDPGTCNNAIPCPTPNCGTATIQVNGN